MSELTKIGARKLQNVNWGLFWLVGAWLVLAVIVGLAAVILPVQYMLAVGGIPVAVVLATGYPAAALFGVLIIAFGLLPQFIFGALPLGSASLQPAELLLILTFVILLMRGAGQWGFIFHQAKPLFLPFGLLAVGVIVGFIKGKMLANNQYAGADFRQYVGWLALPIGFWLIRQQQLSVHKIIVFISLIASVGMIFQLVTGVQIIYGFRGAEELSNDFKDVIRSAIGGGGVFLSYAAYYMFYKYCANKSKNLLWIGGFLIVVGGVVATFSRGIWAGFVFGMVLFVFFTPKTERNKTVVALLLICIAVLIGVVVSVAVPRVGEAVVGRLTSITEEGARGSSVGFRIDENQQAFAAIKKSPLLGAGLGVEYKVVFRQGAIGGGFDTETSLIHNAYLGLWLKLGIAGLLFPFVLMIASLRRVLVLRRSVAVANIYDVENLFKVCAGFSALCMMALYGMSSAEWSMFGSLAAASCMVAIIFSENKKASVNSPASSVRGY